MKVKDQVYETKIANPTMTNAEIAKYLGCTDRYVRKLLNIKEEGEKRIPKILIFDIRLQKLNRSYFMLFNCRLRRCLL